MPAGQDQVGFGGKYGYYQDPTGLYLLGCRYYDPTNARFLTRDPTGYQAGPNLYAYCRDNPITRCDPKGTDPDAPADGNILPPSMRDDVDCVQPQTSTIHKGSGMLITAGNTVSRATPLGAASEALTGQDASGHKVSTVTRTFDVVSFLAPIGAFFGKAAGEATQLHHIFPQSGEFAAQWDRLGFNIHDFTVRIPTSLHQGIHGNAGGDWNADWSEFFKGNANANFKEVTDFADMMMRKYGIEHCPFVKYGTGK